MNLINKKVVDFKSCSLSSSVNDFDLMLTLRFSEGQDCHLGVNKNVTSKELTQSLREFADMIDEAFS